MSDTKPTLPAFPVRAGILSAIAVCLLGNVVMFSGYFGEALSHFASSDVVFVVGVLVETLLAFLVLYRTPVLSQEPGRFGQVGRVAQLVLAAHCLVIVVMGGLAIFWFAACMVLGIPARTP